MLACLPGCKQNSASSTTAPSSNVSELQLQVDALIRGKEYAKATRLVQETDVLKLVATAIESGDHRWLAIYEDALVLPGTPEDTILKVTANDYWVIPGTSDAIEDMHWQRTATQFALSYNRALRGKLADGQQDATGD